MKNQLGYLETHLFTTLGGGVKHGIQVSIEITKFQIPTFCLLFDELRHYTMFEKWVSLETQCFKKLKNLYKISVGSLPASEGSEEEDCSKTGPRAAKMPGQTFGAPAACFRAVSGALWP